MDKLHVLRHRLNEWLHAESREFVPRMELQPYEIENTNKLKIQLFLEHRFNWQDGEKRFLRRSRVGIARNNRICYLFLTVERSRIIVYEYVEANIRGTRNIICVSSSKCGHYEIKFCKRYL